MLGKLLKHEIKSQVKSLFLFWILTVGLALLVRIFRVIEESASISYYLSTIATLTFVVAMVACFVYCFFVAIKNFYKKVLREEGYLANTLPVKKSSIILSFVITDILAIIITALFSLLGCFIAFSGTDGIKYIWDMFVISGEQEFNMSIGEVISIVLGSMLLAYINTILMFYAAMTIGHSFSQNKIPNSIGVGVGFYAGYQILNILGMIDIFLANHTNIMEAFETNTLPEPLITTVIAKGFLVTGIFVIITYLFTNHYLKEKLNLE